MKSRMYTKQTSDQSVWVTMDGTVQQPTGPLIYSGVLMVKQPDQTLVPEQCDLYEDRLQTTIKLCYINLCLLKKGVQSFKLVHGKKIGDFFTSSNDDLDKWFHIMKRYTIQPNFNSEYKLLQRLTHYDKSEVVFLARKFTDGKNYNVKIIEKNQKLDVKRLFQEISILRRVRHQNIVNLLEVYEDSSYVYLVFAQYIGQEMQFRYEEIISQNETGLARIIYKLVEILYHLNQNGVIHGNISIDNLYFRTTKLYDICLSNFANSEFATSNTKNIVGQVGYQAPEILNGKAYDYGIDMYGLGIIFYYMVYQEFPFTEYLDQNDNKTGTIQFVQTKYSQGCMNLLKAMLHPDPSIRITSEVAFHHEWFIQMKVQEKLVKALSIKKKLLPTILEKSDIFSQSPKLKYQSENIGVFEDEFLIENLADRMSQLENVFMPSKTSHEIVKSFKD